MLRSPFAATALLLFAAPVAVAQPPAGYHDYDTFRQQAEELAESPVVTLSSLGQTAEGRDVLLLTLSKQGAADDKPAVLVLGGVQAESLVGSHQAMGIAETLASRANQEGAVSDLLERLTLYIIPRPSPDASERLFDRPYQALSVNRRPRDDDRDGEVDEDPHEDLNGDGWITAMRVRDDTGQYRLHPDDPRVLIKADPTKGELGQYRLLTEGVDNDGDKAWNEDGLGGVAFNRNFTFRYPYFKPGAGPHQVSEPETRAVADFAYDHRNIFLVFSIAPQDNLNHPWKAKSGEGRIKQSPQGDDAKHLDRIAKKYKELVKPKDAPGASDADGAFVPWAYHHYGRWSIATRGWWPPKPEGKKTDSHAEKQESEADGGEKSSDQDEKETDSAERRQEPDKAKRKPQKPDKRGQDDLRALAWFDQAGVDGFVEWTEIEHPDFPFKRVEVGGFKPGAKLHPPVEQLDPAPLTDLLIAVAGMRASLSIAEAETEVLSDGLLRVTASVLNQGGLPTASDMGRQSRQLQRLEIELEGPDGMQVLSGPKRQDLGVLAPGESAKRSWLIKLEDPETASELRVRAGEPSVGFAAREPSHIKNNRADRRI